MSDDSPTGAPAAEREHWLKENLEALAIAIVMALVIRFFCIEAFKIPTGSMKPTLMGDTAISYDDDDGHRPASLLPGDRANQGDRILVNKFIYEWQPMRRWDVVVFKYPLQMQKNFIKRLVGMPGERLLITSLGDVYTAPLEGGDFTIQRKPPAVQRELFIEVFPGAGYDWAKVLDQGWTPPRPGAPEWSVEGDNLRGRVKDAGTPAMLTFAAHNLYNQVEAQKPWEWARRSRGSAQHPWSEQIPDPARFTDLQVEFDFRFDAAASEAAVLVEFDEELAAGRRNLLRFRVPRSGAGSLLANVGGRAFSLAFNAGDLGAGFHRLAAYHVDDSAALFIDGAPVRLTPAAAGDSASPASIPATGAGNADGARFTYVQAAQDALPARNDVRIGAVNADVTFRAVRLLRDIIYEVEQDYKDPADDLGRVVYRVPPDHYMVLGDNSFRSKDSRRWFMLEIALVDGRLIQADFEPDQEEEALAREVSNFTQRNLENAMTLAADPAPSGHAPAAAGSTEPAAWKRALFLSGKESLPLVLDRARAGPQVYALIDTQGRRHAVTAPEIREARIRIAFYVPRDSFIGRAFFVFWPWETRYQAVGDDHPLRSWFTRLKLVR
ncbi:MAG: hypothetical protein HY719_06915 [Planctomycetes bacterium]|nr:hypothetical protein [Planctomycetota bacterium]